MKIPALIIQLVNLALLVSAIFAISSVNPWFQISSSVIIAVLYGLSSSRFRSLVFALSAFNVVVVILWNYVLPASDILLPYFLLLSAGFVFQMVIILMLISQLLKEEHNLLTFSVLFRYGWVFIVLLAASIYILTQKVAIDKMKESSLLAEAETKRNAMSQVNKISEEKAALEQKITKLEKEKEGFRYELEILKQRCR